MRGSEGLSDWILGLGEERLRGLEEDFLLRAWESLERHWREEGGSCKSFYASVAAGKVLLEGLESGTMEKKERVLDTLLGCGLGGEVMECPEIPFSGEEVDSGARSERRISSSLFLQGGKGQEEEAAATTGRVCEDENLGDLRPPQTDLTLLMIEDLNQSWSLKESPCSKKKSSLFVSGSGDALLRVLCQNLESEKDVERAWKVFRVPEALEPLTAERCGLLSRIATGSLRVASRLGGGKGDEKMEESPCLGRSLDIFNAVLDLFISSTRGGGRIAQNFLCSGVRVIVEGLKEELSRAESLKDSVRGFNLLSAALCSQALDCLGLLINDLSQFGESDAEINTLDLFDNADASSRLRYIFKAVDLIPFLMKMTNVSYIKATTLKNNLNEKAERKEPSEDKIMAPSAVPEDDMELAYCDEEDEENDSIGEGGVEDEDADEPLLGKWFADTLFPPDENVEKDKPDEDGSRSSDNLNSLASNSNREPSSFMNLAARILFFIDYNLITNDNLFIQTLIKSEIGESEMSVLASILQDLDRTLAVEDSGPLSKSLNEFAEAMSRVIHNLLAYRILSFDLQSFLLSSLGVNPSDTPAHKWPICVYPRTLSVLAQILLIRQSQKQPTTVYVTLWKKLLLSLSALISPRRGNTEDMEERSVTRENLNVEQIQLFLFLFHALTLMQKKEVLLDVSNTLISTFSTVRGEWLNTSQIMGLSRMVLLLEYIMKNLYEPPDVLLSQVQNNLFLTRRTKDSSAQISSVANTTTIVINDGGSTTTEKSKSSLDMSDLSSVETTVLYCKFQENFGRNEKRPIFFNLFPDTSSSSSSAEIPKLDGLAISFILGTGELLHYDALYQTLIDLLEVVKQNDKKLDTDGLLAMEYCFLITWRTLQSLPPSVKYLEKVIQESHEVDEVCVLHNLILAPRVGHKVFGPWIKDALVKQGATIAKAESLIKQSSTNINTLNYDVLVFKKLYEKMKNQKAFVGSKRGQVLKSKDMPTFFDLLILDAVMAKVQISLDRSFAGTANSKSETDMIPDHIGKAVSSAHDLVPLILQMVESFSVCAKSLILESISGSKFDIMALSRCLSISGTQCLKTVRLSRRIRVRFPISLLNPLEEWDNSSLLGFPAVSSWRSQFSNESALPSEPYITSVITTNISGLRSKNNIKILKHCLDRAARFTGDLFLWCPEFSPLQIVWVLFPLILDATTDSISELIASTLKRLIGPPDSVQFLAKVYQHVLTNTYPILLPDTEPIDIDTTEEIEEGMQRYVLNERILQDIVQYMEVMLDRPIGWATLDQFFSEHDLLKILLSITKRGPEFASQVLKFFNQMFELCERYPTEASLQRLCAKALSKLAEIPSSQLEEWLRYIVTGTFNQAKNLSNEEQLCLQGNRALLRSLTALIVKEENHVAEDVALTILKCLIPMGSVLLSPASEGLEFTDLITVMSTLASAGSGIGHQSLFSACSEWLESCRKYLSQKNVIEKLREGVMTGKHGIMLENACQLMTYMCNIITSLKMLNSNDLVVRPSSPCEGDNAIDDADYWIEDMNDDEDSAGEDSDDDSLCNKLCTYTLTQKEFVYQHWYHCHTCRMVDGAGVCTICAKVCHADHDVTYSKHGSFFCDCGAKEDGSCQAMTKRLPQDNSDSSQRHETADSNASTGLLRHNRGSSPPPNLHQQQQANNSSSNLKNSDSKKDDEILQNLSTKLISCKNELSSQIWGSTIVANLLELLHSLLSVIEHNGLKHSSIGRLSRINKAFQTLHTTEKTYHHDDLLMLPTVGSQEGAFENVRMNYSGDQGQTIRNLMTAYMIRRVVMCCLASGPNGKRQHLAVSHEKGKITVLQLSALLKQADSSQKKLTLTRLASTPVPFSVLSISSNPRNEDFLAVTGLKDCHVLAFNPSGNVSDHLVLHPQLEASNYIIKSHWVPGSQTELALITSDFVKIYDLSLDVLSPQHYFLVPSGKVRDCTLAFMEDGTRYVLIMSSAGHIYVQSLTEESSALNGPFYVTNIMDVNRPEIKHPSSERIGEGGVSIFYCHTLQCLFFSYVQGKSFMAPLKTIVEELETVFPIIVKNNGGSSNEKSSNGNQQPLCQWGEIIGHPGLITAFLQMSNNPVVILVRPDSIGVQELKVGNKSKIIDMVAIRHSITSCAPLSPNQKTTLILLCEDGSLKIYMANPQDTDFWLSPTLHPISCMNQIKTPKKIKKSQQNKKGNSLARTSSSEGASVSFPVDFFEHCSTISEIEFHGNDVLQVYNVNQIKHRLNTSGLYIANMKPNGFSIEVQNNDSNQVIVGIRVMLGTQDVSRIPSHIEVFGRNIPVNLTRIRWFDVPLSREESLQADKKLNITFGPPLDPSGVSIIDNIQVYGKSKENFGWPDDSEEYGLSANEPSEMIDAQPLPMTSLDKLVVNMLELLEGCFALNYESDTCKAVATDLSTQLITLPTQHKINIYAKTLLASLFQNKANYHNRKDIALLRHVTSHIYDEDGDSIDVESYHRLILTARSIAVTRPGNLVKFAETRNECNSELEEKQGFISYLTNAFWQLLQSRSANSAVGKLGQPGLTYIESTVQALMEILHAFISSDVDMVPFICKLYKEFLLSDHLQVSFACKQALIRILRPRVRRRRVFIPSPVHCQSPPLEGNNNILTPAQEDGIPQFDPGFPPPVPAASENESNNIRDNNDNNTQNENLNMGPGGIPLGGVAGNIDALLPLAGNNVGGNGNVLPVLDLQADVDDETMVELAIALSLQDHEGELVNLQQGLQQLANLGLQGFPAIQGLLGGDLGAVTAAAAVAAEGQGSLGGPVISGGDAASNTTPMAGGGAQNPEPSHYSDTTASAPGSDDESTAAMDGSALRTPPVEVEQGPGSGAGSESGASVVESIMGEQSGRSSAYEADALNTKLEVTNSIETEWESNNSKLHSLRLMLLDQFLIYLPNLRDIGGVHCTPFMQVLIVLTTDLDKSNERDVATLEKMLNLLIQELEIDNENEISAASERTKRKELQLVILRLFGVLMSRSKTWQAFRSEGSNFVSAATASALLKSGIIDYCLRLLKNLLNFWKENSVDENTNKVGSSLLKTQPSYYPPDMGPFFLKQYVKSHAHDVFEAYPQLLTEMALRIPYQAKKIYEHASNEVAKDEYKFDREWHYNLCECMMLQQTAHVRRQVRKLLLYICGTKEQYRELRDLHTLESHMRSIRETVENGKTSDAATMLSFPYDMLLKLIEHLKACVDIATSHTANWQKFCRERDPEALKFLFQISFTLDEGVNPIVLQLLQSALCGVNQKSKSTFALSKKKSKSDEVEDSSVIPVLVKQINSHSLLSKFIETFLLECNSTSVRWQAHGLLVTIQKYSDRPEREAIMEILWKLWHQLPYYGRKASQFVDLLGYFSIKTLNNEEKLQEYVSESVAVLKSQNSILSNHPNANLYNSLSQLVEFNGYYLESDPCLVCNNPEVPFRSLKLSALKIDTKYTTSSQIVKLLCSHSIGKINLRIGDLKRQKMVRVINVYYNNRSVQAVVELKNKPTLWHKAKKVTLCPGQTDVKIEFPLPIIACNLRIEYADFYENIQASAETLQCPRCSASVPANPGVCTNCGENVFQCHKCRSINYDEKDPFLCNACGFCKYAKFEYTLHTRPCCAVDPIESEDDYKKAVSSINSLLERADKVYKHLIAYKPALEDLLIKISESSNDKSGIDMADISASITNQSGGGNSNNNSSNSTGSGNSSTAPITSSSNAFVNQFIQTLAHKYCGECKSSFEELSRIIQRVMATRKELVSFDNARTVKFIPEVSKSRVANRSVTSGKCYGCASASVEHCLTLLRALANKSRSREELYQQGLIQQLMEYNLRRGTLSMRLEVRKLICLITRDNPVATNHLNKLLFNKIALALKGRNSCPEIVESVRHEMSLLAATISKEDTCWEQRLRCVLGIFLLATKREGQTSPTVMECITLPCLKILQGLVRPKGLASSKSSITEPESFINVKEWLKSTSGHRFSDWETKIPDQEKKKALKSIDVRNAFLREKYGLKWLNKLRRATTKNEDAASSMILNPFWLKSVLFNPSSQMARQVSCNMVEGFCSGRRKFKIIDLLTSFLGELGKAGESAAEYVQLYQKLISSEEVKNYLAVKGVLQKIAQLISLEIDNLEEMEQTTLGSDLAQGYALKTLTKILSSFVSVEHIKNKYKSRLISTVLQGYLSLRRLIVQRTKLVDQTQDKLLELLEGMTTGTEAETEAFMDVCVQTIKRYPLHDQLTPVFIFERLCNLIFPEETETGEFFMALHKDLQQEDFLQGRMLGNPYSSNDPDLGPLMRDVKDKICTDCELVALLEDDNGMELLVNNKIISLDLPVKDVYLKIWAPEAREGEPMKIIYRMRGLLGDATEEFIETLENKEGEDKDEEEVYKMARVMAQCGGLEVILERFASIQDVQYSKPLLMVLLKLFSHSIKLEVNRKKLLNPSLKTIPLLLHCLKLSLGDPSSLINEMILEAMERLLVEAAAENSIWSYCQFASNCVSREDIQTLLGHAVNLKSGTALHTRLMRVLPFLTYANDDKMELIVGHFAGVLEFDKFDQEHGSDEDAKMEAFVAMCDGIERNQIGNTMKDLMIGMGIIKQCIDYIKLNAPASKNVLLKADDPYWKAFVTKPSLKYILRAMAGLAVKHSTTQLAVSHECISILHQMEQVSSDEHVGSLAEAVLEALKGHPEACSIVVEVRQRTKTEKKKLAMAMRAKQLKAIGLKANERGQVKADNSILQQFVEIAEESGLSCNICREGYKFQPSKVLAIYTYTKECPLDEFEPGSRKQIGYSTVTHFNLVHVDCHLAAVRQARLRDEWESALLQNANTKCNGLLPLWGPQVAESAYASCLARHNTYLGEATQHRDIGYHSTIHDLKLLLLRFAQDKSFSAESGGGGPQSNMHLVPYLMHMALYVINTTRAVPRETLNLKAFLDQPKDRWMDSCYVPDGPMYYAIVALLVYSPSAWKSARINLLQRLLLMAHVRFVNPNRRDNSLTDRELKEYDVYKKVILFFALIDQLYCVVFGNVRTDKECWPVALSEWIRHNDDALTKSTSKLLATFQKDLVPATSVDEIIDVCGLLEEIPFPASFFMEVLSMENQKMSMSGSILLVFSFLALFVLYTNGASPLGLYLGIGDLTSLYYPVSSQHHLQYKPVAHSSPLYPGIGYVGDQQYPSPETLPFFQEFRSRSLKPQVSYVEDGDGMTVKEIIEENRDFLVLLEGFTDLPPDENVLDVEGFLIPHPDRN